MPRLFTGLEIPDEQRGDLMRLRQPLPGSSRWTEPDNLHITLRFFGDMDNRKAAELIEQLDAISIDAFQVRLSGLGVFGGNEPRSIWAGVEAGPELEALARATERAARAVGLPPDTRPFKPHVTLARLKYASPDLVARFLGRVGAFRCEPFLAGRFVLFSSRPKVGGGPYGIEETFALRGGEFVNYEDLGEGW